MDEQKECQLRFSVPEDLHKKVVQVQGLLRFKENKKINQQDTYIRMIELGVAAIMKSNR